MSNKKISQLNSGGSLLTSDWYPIRRGGANYYVTGQMIIDACLFDDSQILSSLTDLQTNKLNLDGSNGPMLGNLDMGIYRITSTGVPSISSHLVNKQYVDTKFLPLSGGTLTGYLTLHANPANPLHAATKQYVDQLVATITAGATNTNQLPEGTDSSATGLGTDTDGNRKYFTGARFDSKFATKTTDNLAEGSVNKYFTTSRFDLNFNAKTTDNLLEGSTNLYFTNNRARTALSAVGPILYNSATGAFSFDNSVLVGVSFGGATRIPFMNSTADDFIYSAGLTYDGTKLIANSLKVSTYTFPTGNGTTGQFLQTNGSGTVSWADVTGFIDGTGGANQISYFIDSNTIASDSRFKHEASSANFNIFIDNSSNPTVDNRNQTSIGGVAGFSQYSNSYSQLTLGSYNNGGYSPILMLSRGRGSLTSASPYFSGDTLGIFRIGGVDIITGVAAENGNTGWGQNTIFKSAAIGTTTLTEVMRLKPNGKLRIGNQYDLPNVDGLANQVLTTDGSGVVSWASVSGGGGGLTGVGLTDRLARWNTTTDLGYGIIRDNGTIGINIAADSSNMVTIAAGASITTGIKSEAAFTGSGVGYGGYFYAKGIHGSSNVGVYGAADGSNGGLNMSNIGVHGMGYSDTNTTKGIGGYFNGINQQVSAQALSIGIQAVAGGSTSAKYAAWLQDGTETVAGRFLKNMTNDGKANWASITTSDIAGFGTYALVGTYTDGFIPRWNSTTNTLASGTIRDNGSEIGIGTSIDTNYLVSIFSSAKETTFRLDNTRTGNNLTNIAALIATSSANAATTGSSTNTALQLIASGASGFTSKNIGIDVSATTTTAGKNIAGIFNALNGVGVAHALKLTDGSEGTGKFLISTDSTGLSKWATVNEYAEKLSPSISADYVLIWDGSVNLHKKVLLGNLPGTGGGGGSIGGGGTLNYLARWTSASNIGIGTIQDNGSSVLAGDYSSTFSTNYYFKTQTSTHRYGGIFETFFTGGGAVVGLVGRTLISNTADSNTGIFGVAAGNNVLNMGVQGVADFTSATATNIGGEFEGKGGLENYPLRLVSADLSANGKFLKALTADGKANWASITASDVSGVQVALVSGTTIKTINGQSILGSGNLQVTTSGSDLYNFNNFI